MPSPVAFHGTLIHSVTISEVEILENTLLVVDGNGLIVHLEPGISPESLNSRLASFRLNLSPSSIHHLRHGDFLIPGFIDTHNHAPQWNQRGLGRGLQILDWLDQITFKNESKFADTTHAARVYEKCVSGMLKQGVTTASYYASLHGPATNILADTCLRKGQRALIGKCNMDRNSPSFYIEPSAQDSLDATRDVISHIQSIDPTGATVRPVITPRFAISCTDELLSGLGDLARAHPTLPIQTHFNEAQSEIDATLSLFPQFTNEVDLYKHFNLLTRHTILAHCCHMTPSEITSLQTLDCGIAHCPIANTTVGGGFMAAPIRTFLNAGITKIGLGTDSGGGFSSSILDAMRQAFIVSNAREMMSDGKEKAVSIDEAFYMATWGGAKVCGIGEKVGRFEVGKEFDAILVRTEEDSEPDEHGLGGDVGVMTPVEEGDSVRTVFEKFIMSGDDRNFATVWVKGRQVKG
ncbi:hypothetical protein H2198_008726 [Neophaeococcomyces mojaviensis]|uniref:Uncharacterized protein n=1 Tax=Neophaeococcomyces mojaviensis TaxID=3383035 RepID=A0ACC2ZWK6_9EURO|nr:hypothetical protein H2198_008726 [Knufia sp. JES_112]